MNIVIVEGDPLQLRALTHLCRCFGACDDVQGFATANEALGYILSHPPQLILTEVELPDSSGLFLADQVRRHCVNVSLAFVTANKDFAYLAYQYQALAYVLKPYLDEQIQSLLRQVAAQPVPQPAASLC